MKKINDLTKILLARNDERDELTRYVCAIIEAKQLSPVADEKVAA